MQSPAFFRRSWFGALVLIALASATVTRSQRVLPEIPRGAPLASKGIRPGTVATSSTGYAMKAKLNGKEWQAESMYPPDGPGRIIGYKGEEYIGLPYDRRYLVAGRVIDFNERQVADLGTDDDVGIWGGRSGQMRITKVDAHAAEGTFHFTATSTSTGSKQKVEVTDGTFRILLGNR